MMPIHTTRLLRANLVRIPGEKEGVRSQKGCRGFILEREMGSTGGYLPVDTINFGLSALSVT